MTNFIDTQHGAGEKTYTQETLLNTKIIIYLNLFSKERRGLSITGINPVFN